MDLPAEPLAREAVGELVGGGDGENGQPGHEENLKPVEVEEGVPDLARIDDGDGEREEDEGRGEDQERGREEEPQLLDQAVEEPIGIEGLQPQVKEIPAKGSARAGPVPRPAAFRLQEAEPSEVFDELFEGFRSKGSTKLLLESLLDDIEGR